MLTRFEHSRHPGREPHRTRRDGTRNSSTDRSDRGRHGGGVNLHSLALRSMGLPQTDTRERQLGGEDAVCAAILAAARRVAERDGILRDVADRRGPGGPCGSRRSLRTFQQQERSSACRDRGRSGDPGSRHARRRRPGKRRARCRRLPPPRSRRCCRLPISMCRSRTGIPLQWPRRKRSSPRELCRRRKKQTEQTPVDAAAPRKLLHVCRTVERLEKRPVDAWLERRLREFERALAALEGQHVERNTAEIDAR